MKWITRERVKVDRGACPWLIRNFIDPEAEFVFQSRDTEWSKIRKLCLSDHEILKREFAVYDGLYLECKERISDGVKPIPPPSLFEIACTMR
jgi:hypothetical protein